MRLVLVLGRRKNGTMVMQRKLAVPLASRDLLTTAIDRFTVFREPFHLTLENGAVTELNPDEWDLLLLIHEVV